MTLRARRERVNVIHLTLARDEWLIARDVDTARVSSVEQLCIFGDAINDIIYRSVVLHGVLLCIVPVS